MQRKYITTTISVLYLSLVESMNLVLFFWEREYKGGNSGITEVITEYATLAAAVTALGGIVTTVVTQILFYRKDAQTMDEIRNNVISGHERLNDRMDDKEKRISAEHGRLSDEHKDIRDIVRDIRLCQEQEMRLREKIRDTVPNAGVIKDGIEKICRENAQLKEEMIGLKHELQQVKEKNQELVRELQRNSRSYDIEPEL